MAWKRREKDNNLKVENEGNCLEDKKEMVIQKCSRILFTKGWKGIMKSKR